MARLKVPTLNRDDESDGVLEFHLINIQRAIRPLPVV